jgi:hypothetical protein
MQEQFLSWLAGFIDGDGSIHIGVRIQNNGRHEYIAIRPVLNVTQHIQYKWACEYIAKNLKVGSVYVANRSHASAKATWQTLRIEDIIQVLEQIKPFLIVKKRQANIVLPALKLWAKQNKNGKAGTNTYGGQKIRSQKTVLRIVKIATTLNATMRNSANARGYKTYEEWEPIIKRMYPR